MPPDPPAIRRADDVQVADFTPTAPDAIRATSGTFYLILYPQFVADDIVSLLDRVGVPGFTETNKVIGRGRRGRHFDNAVWPGADGMIYVVVGPDHAGALDASLAEYNRDLEGRSKGVSGIHVFTWPCDQLI
jgi:hypothetical protein